MKRKMIGAAAAYIAGLFFASFFMGAVPILIIASAAVIAAVRFRFTRADCIMLAVCFAAALTVSSFYTRFYYDKITSTGGKTSDFSGEIVDIRHYSGDKASYTLKGGLDGLSGVKVTVYADDLGAQYGDKLYLRDCKFERLSGDYLSGSTDYMRSERVFIRVSSFKGAVLEKTGTRRFRNTLVSYREKMIDSFCEAIGEDAGGFLSGMVFGEKQWLDEDVKTALYRCGIGHVLAVSGLHVSIIAVALMSLLGALRVNRYVSFALMDILIAMLIVMANSPVSAVRAALMMNVAYSARLFRRQNDTFNSLSLALLVICLANPYVIYSSGFVLSAVGTFGIGVFAPYMTKNMSESGIMRRLFKMLCAMLCTNVCLLPFTMKYFEETSLISPVLNVFLVPMCSVPMLLGAVYVITGGLAPVLRLAGAIINLILFISDKASRIGGFYFSCSSREIITLSLFLTLGVIVVYALSRSRRAVAVMCMLSCSVVFVSSAAVNVKHFGELRAAILGNKGNAAVVISYRGSVHIIDLSGNHKSPGYVRKYLLENGISHADALILTEKTQSQYAAYLSKLESVKIDSIVAADEIPLRDDITYLDEAGGFTFEEADYSIAYSGGIVDIFFGETHLAIAPANAQIDETADAAIFYKGPFKNKSDGYYVINKNAEDGMDNFEITLDKSGGHKTRRL